jgi:hypothetical protein
MELRRKLGFDGSRRIIVEWATEKRKSTSTSTLMAKKVVT